MKVKIVTYDGDSNGATTLQAKIQLWNRTGKGWPTSSSASRPTTRSGWHPSRSTSRTGQGPHPGEDPQPLARTVARPVHRQRQGDLRPGQPRGPCCGTTRRLAQVRLHGPDDWHQWAARPEGREGAPGLHHREHRDSYSHWTYLWAGQCPLSQVQKNGSVRINSTNLHSHPDGQLLDPLIKNGTTPPENIFTPAFAQKYGGKNPKVLMMPGPTWYAKDVFSGTLKILAGRMAAAMPLRWKPSHRSRPARSAAVRGSSRGIPRTSAPLLISSPGSRPRQGQGQGPWLPVVRACRQALVGEPARTRTSRPARRC